MNPDRPREPHWLLRPFIDNRVFVDLREGVQPTLAALFLKWTFRATDHPGTARPLRNGDWYPMRPTVDDYGHEQPLGEGGVGVAHLWGCIDENNRVIDRVIVKNNYPGTATWSRPHMWRDGQIGGEPRESMIGNHVYNELEAANPGDGKYVTRCFGYGGVYKLYLEYCPLGDLWDQISRQAESEEVPVRKKRGSNGRLRVEKVRSPSGRFRAKTKTIENFPYHEGFVWMMFEALAKCAVAMERANFVHGDMAPSNIFLDENNSNRFKIWPLPKLADFGSSRYIDPATKDRSAGLNESIQELHAPPELMSIPEGWEMPGLEVTHRTNIWQIGMIIICMMRLDPELP
ncbi:hypothetical protein AUEXF2481DRAFT_7398 [Aureobasidium subglaciale EXF-2481]|uniref:EKC/KEOPS complex subunit BUD32 n=1 Tax=Aureobasidium subglaciale (strain EXF-2481) TaxID=1043005 RepID=A0A074Z0Q4_AURSE|nr:uncharacterized protein AUEXF2481DRAFT_7398 [Aureobasidium subglaciale EXF-2481]KEQ92656.1 hypothetical protein AUEXF2481DRAFT_7398 [Aureobasidium subglaciale EXF-2481]